MRLYFMSLKKKCLQFTRFLLYEDFNFEGSLKDDLYFTHVCMFVKNLLFYFFLFRLELVRFLFKEVFSTYF